MTRNTNTIPKMDPTTTTLSLRNEMRCVLNASLFIMFENLFMFIPTITANIFIGHLPNSAPLMAGSSLSRSFTEVTGNMVAWGLCMTLRTLLPQTFGSAYKMQVGEGSSSRDIRAKHLMAVHFQRCLLISAIILVPLTVLQFFAANLLLLIGESADLCTVASIYCRVLIIFLWVFAFWTASQTLLQVANLNKQLFCIAVTTGSLSLPCNYLLVYYLDFGYIGTAITIDICVVLSAIASTVLLYSRGYGFVFRPLPLSVLCTWDGITGFLKLALPLFVRAIISMWVMESLIALSGFVKNPDISVAASSILYACDYFICLIAYSIDTVVSLRVGHYIGANNIPMAKKAMYCCLFIGSTFMLFCDLLLVTLHDQLPYIWTSDADIVHLASSLLMYVSPFRTFGWLLYLVPVGVYAGLGMPVYTPIGTFIFLWVVSIPTEFVLLFFFDLRKYILPGILVIWETPTFARIACSIAFFIHILIFVDWDKAVQQSEKRLLTAKKDYGTISTSMRINQPNAMRSRINIV